MGNCLKSLFSNPTPTSTVNCSTTPTSNTGPFSGTSSSGGRSGLLAAAASDDTGEIPTLGNLKRYSYLDMEKATRNFRPESVLGMGGFGKVYKGWVDKKTLAPCKPDKKALTVAVKQLNHENVQGFREWQSEVNFLGRLSHPNLVRLLGYCWEDRNLLLVYEFVRRGSLENNLFRRNTALKPLSWELRLKIVLGAARGLAFLHSLETQVIYREFKASNILLDEDYNAKLIDFGLAKLGPSGGELHVTTQITGTNGYAAPEYTATGLLYVKSDVYGFGVVLLEMMTGWRAFDSQRPSYQQNLVEWVLTHKKKLMSIMDAGIEGQYSLKAVMLASQLALRCLEPEAKKRASMKEVVEALEKIEALEVKQKESKTSTTHFNGSRKLWT